MCEEHCKPLLGDRLPLPWAGRIEGGKNGVDRLAASEIVAVPAQKSEALEKPRDFPGATIALRALITILTSFVSALSFRLRSRASDLR
jgi:hypothetical protein